MNGSKRQVFEVESYDEEAGGWVLETSRTDRKAAEDDVDDFRTVGKRARIVGESEGYAEVRG